MWVMRCNRALRPHCKMYRRMIGSSVPVYRRSVRLHSQRRYMSTLAEDQRTSLHELLFCAEQNKSRILDSHEVELMLILSSPDEIIPGKERAYIKVVSALDNVEWMAALWNILKVRTDASVEDQSLRGAESNDVSASLMAYAFAEALLAQRQRVLMKMALPITKHSQQELLDVGGKYSALAIQCLSTFVRCCDRRDILVPLKLVRTNVKSMLSVYSHGQVRADAKARIAHTLAVSNTRVFRSIVSLIEEIDQPVHRTSIDCEMLIADHIVAGELSKALFVFNSMQNKNLKKLVYPKGKIEEIRLVPVDKRRVSPTQSTMEMLIVSATNIRHFGSDKTLVPANLVSMLTKINCRLAHEYIMAKRALEKDNGSVDSDTKNSAQYENPFSLHEQWLLHSDMEEYSPPYFSVQVYMSLLNYYARERKLGGTRIWFSRMWYWGFQAYQVDMEFQKYLLTRFDAWKCVLLAYLYKNDKKTNPVVMEASFISKFINHMLATVDIPTQNIMIEAAFVASAVKDGSDGLVEFLTTKNFNTGHHLSLTAVYRALQMFGRNDDVDGIMYIYAAIVGREPLCATLMRPTGKYGYVTTPELFERVRATPGFFNTIVEALVACHNTSYFEIIRQDMRVLGIKESNNFKCLLLRGHTGSNPFQTVLFFLDVLKDDQFAKALPYRLAYGVVNDLCEQSAAIIENDKNVYEALELFRELQRMHVSIEKLRPRTYDKAKGRPSVFHEKTDTPLSTSELIALHKLLTAFSEYFHADSDYVVKVSEF